MSNYVAASKAVSARAAAMVAPVFVLLASACVPEAEPDHSATRAAEKRRDATVVARAVQVIQATNTAESKEAACLAEPPKCRSLGLDWPTTVRKCRETGRSDCSYPVQLIEPRNPPRRP